MSLCNTFRFFAVSTTIVLSIVGSPVPGLGRQDSIAPKILNQDLEHQGSLTVELKSNDKGPNYMNSLKLSNVKGDTSPISLDSENAKKNVNKNSYQTITSTDKTAQDIGATNVEKTTSISLAPVTNASLSTLILSITSVSQQTEAVENNTIKFENSNPVNISETLEKKGSIKQDLILDNNDTISENKTKHMNSSTTIELERSTEATALDIKLESTINTKIETETLPITNTEVTIPIKSAKSLKLSSLMGGVTAPTWKKYTAIERKRVGITSDEISSTDTSTDNMENLVSTLSEESTTVTEKSEVMVKSASAQGRISLQDAITSDIPSLEKLKTDLLSFPKFTTKSDTESTTGSFATDESITKTDITTFITTTFPSDLNSESPNTFSSKRAGYLDLSAKNSTAADDISLKPNGTESLQGPFDVETPDTQDESLDDKDRRTGSQSQLAEDAIKEELLKEEMLNDNEEISKRHRDEGKQVETDTPALLDTQKDNATQFDDKPLQPSHTAPDENLSVRPINSDKAKNTVLYPVNPNYKPLKKIEVQPAKPFVRDPDDNSWRNESLSSLGIVFKPKNSSKPFTQVLKNKTETEWNNLPEKDIKSEVPDLRVRLEQIAQKRKSKKKKIDSFGNVYYTDYEESSSSEENPSTPQTEEPTFSTVPTTDTDVSTPGITIVTPIQTTSLSTSAAPSSDANDVPALTTTAAPAENSQTTPKREPTKVNTLKRPKMFNLFDYYENDDEDIADYLNMAKIDLKKFTVPIHTTFTPYTTPPLPILYTNPMTPYTPERKGTIQYFPPRTTKRPKKIKYNNIPNKINPFPLTDSPKHVIPISYHKLTTPYGSDAYYTDGPLSGDARYKEEPKTFDRSLYLTTPPLTTVPEEFGVIGSEEGDGRPGYVMKHFKDYLGEVGEAGERGKPRPYSFTEQPASDVTAADYIRPPTPRDRTTTEDYDYEAEFRKDLLDRFVANFNERTNRFKSDFPVVYNNSIVHGPGGPGYDDKDVAMSRAYFRRPSGAGGPDYRPLGREPYDPNCDNTTVELSPAYELHYYVPEQEERQQVEPKPINLPPRYRL